MLRHYFVSNDLDELEEVEHELEQQGFSEPQIHVLSENDTEVENHHLHEVAAVLKQDVVHSTELGALIGVIAAGAIILLTYLLNWHLSAAGWVPFIFLAIIILGFCTWEGGFIGIQQPNVNFKRFQEMLHNGKHILFVDVEPRQELALANVMKTHPNVGASGFGESTPNWVIRAQDNFKRFMKVMP
ncbi:NAD/FAD-utilizing enzyme [Colwellia sp. MT41]|uniref:NAD/FAD-utilizing enzyme n=1 Tax=Colwellia marinimaniae TaxID=1513592 RepID=A0ABQ0MW61_9GAMM|nr:MULTISPECIES: hypothetical protein [Colwellia]ALO35741.1 NAD/FAD-utilizing enzyme [Colwellia sp. MT41]GAW95861.1 hypothetical protein MTCD1_01464 [Colwellia marinimaniae]